MLSNVMLLEWCAFDVARVRLKLEEWHKIELYWVIFFLLH